MNTFIVSFDSERFSGKQKLLDGMMNNHRLVESWASPFPGCYLVKTEATVPKFRETLDDAFERKGFLVCVIERGKSNTDGRVAGPIWDWLKASPVETSEQ